ncbi:hypothetical protein MHIMP23_13450 [Methylobacterium hispanicum]
MRTPSRAQVSRPGPAPPRLRLRRRGAGLPVPRRPRGGRRLRPATGRRRVGLLADGRAPVRAGAPLFADDEGKPVGHVTSGGFGPSLGAPVAMGYLPCGLTEPGTRVRAEVRGQRLPLTVAPLPFLPAGFKRG